MFIYSFFGVQLVKLYSASRVSRAFLLAPLVLGNHRGGGLYPLNQVSQRISVTTKSDLSQSGGTWAKVGGHATVRKHKQAYHIL